MSGSGRSGDQVAGALAPSDGGLLVDEAYAAAFVADGLDSVAALFVLPGGQRLDKASLPTWRERIRFELPGAGTMYLKRYGSPPVGQQLRRILSGRLWGGTARMEWDRMRELEAAGVASVKAVALGEEMVGFWERRSVLVATAVPGESLEGYAQRHPGRWSRGLVEDLARFVARFHQTGCVHRDLYLSHIFIDPAGEQGRFRLIDLARVFHPRWFRRRWIVKELASLDYSTPPGSATATDRLRFLRVYLGRDRFNAGDRRLIRRVVGKTSRIARHDARRQQRDAQGRQGGARGQPGDAPGRRREGGGS